MRLAFVFISLPCLCLGVDLNAVSSTCTFQFIGFKEQSLISTPSLLLACADTMLMKITTSRPKKTRSCKTSLNRWLLRRRRQESRYATFHTCFLLRANFSASFAMLIFYFFLSSWCLQVNCYKLKYRTQAYRLQTLLNKNILPLTSRIWLSLAVTGNHCK